MDIFIHIFSLVTENTEVSVHTHVPDANKWNFWVKMNIHLKCYQTPTDPFTGSAYWFIWPLSRLFYFSRTISNLDLVYSSLPPCSDWHSYSLTVSHCPSSYSMQVACQALWCVVALVLAKTGRVPPHLAYPPTTQTFCHSQILFMHLQLLFSLSHRPFFPFTSA